MVRRRVLAACLAALALIAGCEAAREPRPPAQAAAAPTRAAAVPAAPVDPLNIRRWQPIGDDGIRDPGAPGLTHLQQPSEALRELPPAHEGNQVDWAAALREGKIAPRANVLGTTQVRVLDLDVIMPNTAGLPMVRFPHRPHTEWLDCTNCHDRIFKPKAGANKIGMFAILQGEFCGQCHGAVAFPLTQCRRCHSVERDSLRQARPAG